MSWLFQPSTTYRVRPGTDQGSPVPFDEPHADNPPDGAVLDYYLKDTRPHRCNWRFLIHRARW
ncbi:MAG TPA: hypothetical protein VH140_08300 [Candidatus Acidoferrum sp.]|nr:hypothetical protein [Candidatus Acidoferrum sp.]